jgi:hypothetical protein
LIVSENAETGWVGRAVSLNGEPTEGKEGMDSDDWREDTRGSTFKCRYCPSKDPSCTSESIGAGKDRRQIINEGGEPWSLCEWVRYRNGSKNESELCGNGTSVWRREEGQMKGGGGGREIEQSEEREGRRRRGEDERGSGRRRDKVTGTGMVNGNIGGLE